MKPRKSRPGFDSLEPRAVPATFGVPWTDPGNLSLSFVPDGTPIAAHTSDLYATLDSLGSTSDWQREVVRAFQRWARVANLDIRIRADEGVALGAPGFAQGDPRFGDVRIAAHAMALDALAVAVANDPTAGGTLAGDIFLNSAIRFDGSPYDLFSILLHEAGHVLGVGHSGDPGSPMHAHFNNQKEDLQQGDIAAIQSLYGARAPDRYESPNGNEEQGTATQIPLPLNYTGATPLVVFGDINNDDDDSADVDHFRFRNPSGYKGPLTIRLRTSGVSVLAPRILLLNANGDILREAETQSALGDVLTLRLPASSPQQTYYIRIDSGNDDDDFDTGGYAISVRFDGLSSVADADIDRVMLGPHKTLSADAINALFVNPGTSYFDNDLGSNDSLAKATPLSTTAGYAANSHFETVASIHKSNDRDFYRFQTPSGSNPVITVALWSNDPRGLTPRVRVLSATGANMPATVLASGQGTYTVQFAKAQPNTTYHLVTTNAKSAPGALGNYVLTVDVGNQASKTNIHTKGTLSDASPLRRNTLYIARSQWFQFVLAAGKMPPGARVRAVITDSEGRECLNIAAADFAGASVFLTPGEYSVAFTLEGTPLGAGKLVNYRLVGSGISDPMGPVTEDPTMKPIYGDPGSPIHYVYPDGTRKTVQYHWVAAAL